MKLLVKLKQQLNSKTHTKLLWPFLHVSLSLIIIEIACGFQKMATQTFTKHCKNSISRLIIKKVKNSGLSS